MKFKMINGNDIQCVVTEEEMKQYGLGINDIFSNTQKAQSFLNEILDLVEEETGCFVGDGAKTVQAVCLPDNAVALTFSDRKGAEDTVSELAEKKIAVLGFHTIAEAIAFTRSLDFSGYEHAMFCTEKDMFYAAWQRSIIFLQRRLNMRRQLKKMNGVRLIWMSMREYLYRGMPCMYWQIYKISFRLQMKGKGFRKNHTGSSFPFCEKCREK